jgi:hypothetical protein
MPYQSECPSDPMQYEKARAVARAVAGTDGYSRTRRDRKNVETRACGGAKVRRGGRARARSARQAAMARAGLRRRLARRQPVGFGLGRGEHEFGNIRSNRPRPRGICVLRYVARLPVRSRSSAGRRARSSRPSQRKDPLLSRQSWTQVFIAWALNPVA